MGRGGDKSAAGRLPFDRRQHGADLYGSAAKGGAWPHSSPLNSSPTPTNPDGRGLLRMELNIHDDQGAESKMRNRNLWRAVVALGLALLAPARETSISLLPAAGRIWPAAFFSGRDESASGGDELLAGCDERGGI